MLSICKCVLTLLPHGVTWTNRILWIYNWPGNPETGTRRRRKQLFASYIRRNINTSVVCVSKCAGLLTRVIDYFLRWNMSPNNDVREGRSGRQALWSCANSHLHTVETKEQQRLLYDAGFRLWGYSRGSAEKLFGLVWMKSWSLVTNQNLATSVLRELLFISFGW